MTRFKTVQALLVVLGVFSGVCLFTDRTLQARSPRFNAPQLPTAQVTPFPLKRIPASRLATILAERFHARTARITWDDDTNTLWVLADANTVEKIREFIATLDDRYPSSSCLMVFRLKYVLASDAAKFLTEQLGDDVCVSVDDRTNSIVVAGGFWGWMEKVPKVVAWFDVPNPKHAP